MMKRPVRVLWLMNHTTLRRFEVGQLRALGISEIYCPKSFPYDEGNLSATVDASLDASLSIPENDLQILNGEDWYESPSAEAWRIANRHFDIAITGFFPRQIESCAMHFEGALVMRAFGLARGHSYTRILSAELGPMFLGKLRELGDRFWFGAGYEHLSEMEGDLLRRRNCFLPVGLDGDSTRKEWLGNDKRVFFVCPRIETSPYFKQIYQHFRRDFAGFDYVIGGAQPIRTDDPNVLGFVTEEQHRQNMCRLRVMFYHGTEPNHIHYHPLEAVRAGMPLVFMAGGLLDRLGGEGLPGRCQTIDDARSKLKRIIAGDNGLIEAIRRSQARLLESISPEACLGAWRTGIQRIREGLDRARITPLTERRHKPRIAVIVPIGYRGGSLRAAKLLAQAIELGSRQAGEGAEVIFGHLDNRECYPEGEFSDLPSSIKRRPYTWRIMAPDESCRAIAYAGYDIPVAPAPSYLLPDDGINQFMDCDLWIVISDRLSHPLLPIRPYALMVFDYLQRYESFMPSSADLSFLGAAHSAQRVFVTTEFTRRDAIQYAGLPASRVVKLPILAPTFVPCAAKADREIEPRGYFLWTTNLALHKNHENAFKALRLYYEKYAGHLECRVTGVETTELLKSDLPHIKPLRGIIKGSPLLKSHMKILGELPDETYQSELAGASFLWHAGRVDAGTLSVVEAAHLGVPSLSSDYPPMREYDAQFGLNIAWMDSHDPESMAGALRRMETEAPSRRLLLPGSERLATQSLAGLAAAHWSAVRDCL
jgi:glycosyltransferase involved in cell wall biosynthesis